MDYNQYQSDQNQNNHYERQDFHNPGLTMATAALFLGIGALFTILTVFLPLLLGGLAILFAILSKGYGKKMLTQAKVGLACGLGGLLSVVTIFTASYAVLFSNPDMLVEIGQQYDEACEDMYGQSAEDMFGISFEDMMEDYADALRK